MVAKQNTVLLVALYVALILFLGCSSAPARMLDTSGAILYDFIELYPYDAEGHNKAVEDGGYDFWGTNPLPREQACKYGIYRSCPFTIKSGQKIEITVRSKYPASTNRGEPCYSPVMVVIWPVEWQGLSADIRMDATAVKNFGDAWETTLTQRYPQKESGEYLVSTSNLCKSFFSKQLGSVRIVDGFTMHGNENDRLWVEYIVRYASK